jgi:hypothetical protein
MKRLDSAVCRACAAWIRPACRRAAIRLPRLGPPPWRRLPARTHSAEPPPLRQFAVLLARTHPACHGRLHRASSLCYTYTAMLRRKHMLQT